LDFLSCDALSRNVLKILTKASYLLFACCSSCQLQRWRLGVRQIDIAGCEQESDKQRFKGDPHDLIVFDEGTDFLESQYRFIIGWNRSTDPKQRCRVAARVPRADPLRDNALCASGAS
jgi:hypothetical protein